jgi:hypothetical protein
MKNYHILIIATGSLLVGYNILMGNIPSHYFAGELNEIGCAVIAFTMGVLSMVAFDWKGLGKFLTKYR